MRSARPVTACNRETAAKTLGHGGDVGHDAMVLHGEQRAGAGKAGLHFVSDQHDAILVGISRNLTMNARGTS